MSWVPQPAGDTPHNVRDAALRGASLAFSKPPPQPQAAAKNYTGGDNGAFLAATRVGTRSPASVRRDYTGGSVGGARPYLTKSDSNNSLRVPDDHADRVSSPSNIAARLAAARHSPLRPTSDMSEPKTDERDALPPAGSVGNVLARLEHKKSIQQSQRRRDSLGSHSAASKRQRPRPHHETTDDTPIPPTNSLVKLFEQARPTTPTAAAPLHITQDSPPPVRSPKPQRAFRMPPEPKEDAVPLRRTKTNTPPPVKPKPNLGLQLSPRNVERASEQAYFNTPQKDPVKSPRASQKPVQLTPIKTATSAPPKPPPSRKSSRQARPKSQDAPRPTSSQTRKVSTPVESFMSPSSPSSFKSAKEEQEDEEEKEKLKPSLPPPRRTVTPKTNQSPAIRQIHPSAPILIEPRTQSQNPAPAPRQNLSPPRRPTSTTGSASPSVYHNNYQRESVKQITQHMTGESLSSAIMGAALASHSRTVSPAPRPVSVEPLFPPRKQHHRHHSPFHRSPSPPKQSPPKNTGKLRTTMRKELSSSDDEDTKVDKYKKKGTRIMGIKGRKHPNKHHEGTRRRWRDQITDRERKRYEGVWAANKGLYLPSSSTTSSSSPDTDPSADVLNLCVQDIWTRSRLPAHVLEEVWDLVDSRGIGRLTRYEFVVGLWLIDQRLKGRKLPVKVSDSVWQSARGVTIKVKIRD
ncbi:hypothetical protein GMOD_00000803 [Pyrenophora seminiperda CCB06]|uniref:EH domain-containing protein n=1 Tax=Pyrenophora seminiperda CCB06 TaxID=1302712 RepID=A0A3M7M852_9PLEO|nr:hypothetical protein GMOD_00000803 [Pyrenophora seminiperda CCB06]